METAFRSEERFTQEEFWEWLQERPVSDRGHYELIRGRIVMTPPAGWVHGGVGSTLNGLVGNHVRAEKLGFTFDASTGYDLPSGDTLEPDFSFVSNQRLARGPKPVPGRFLRIVPDLAVEILSRSTARRDRTEKLEIYAENGVDEYWLVDTDARTITVLVQQGSAFDPGVVIDRGLVPSRVLPNLQLNVEDLFSGLPS